MSICETCNQQCATRWPHQNAQESCPCSPLGRVVTGHNVPAGDDIRLDSNYHMSASRSSYQLQRQSTLGKVQTGRKEHAPKTQSECCNRFQSQRLSPTMRLQDPCATQATIVRAAAPSTLPFDTSSFTIGILLGIFGGVFIWTATGRGICRALGMKCAKSLEK